MSKPAFEAFVVTDGKTDKDPGYWTKVGAAWPTSKGGGLNLTIIDGISVSGRIVLMPPKAEDPAPRSERGRSGR